MAVGQVLRLRIQWQHNGTYVLEIEDSAPAQLGQSSGEHSDPYFGKDDLRALNRSVRNELDGISGQLRKNLRLTKSESAAVGRRLAQIGSDMFSRIFSEQLQLLLINHINSRSIKSITIISDDFVIPWEILYLGEVSSKLDFNAFLGQRCFIRRIIRYSHDQTLADPDIYADPKPVVGFLTNDRLAHVAEREKC